MEEKQLKELKAFTDLCKRNPEILYKSELSFFKEYLLSLGATIPLVTKQGSSKGCSKDDQPSTMTVDEDIEESEESEVELEKLDVLEPDEDMPLEMGDENKEVTDEEFDLIEQKRMDAQKAFSESKFDEALNLYTEAIKLQPISAVLHVKRAICLLQLNRPNAAIHDCSQALKYNPDSATAYKFRGRAHRLLGNWEAAAHDLRLACQLDYNEETKEWLKEVTPNAEKLEEHHRKYERNRMEKDVAMKKEKMKKIIEEREKAAKEQAKRDEENKASYGEKGFPDFSSMFSDPELLTAIQDPDVAAAMADISKNPANFAKYASNPKISSILTKLATKFGGKQMPSNFTGSSANKPHMDHDSCKSGSGDLGLD